MAPPDRPDPWDVQPTRTPGNQPLPKLDEFLKLLRDKVVPVVAPLVAQGFYSWDKAKLDAIKSKFKPYAPESGMGCMQACYDVLGILYTPKVATELRQEIWKRAMAKATAYANAHPAQLKQEMEKAKAANPQFDDAKARRYVLEQWTSPHNTSDHMFELMRERDLAGEKVHTENRNAEQAIRDMTANAPGVYVYGMAVNDYHTVTLAVERAADGTQKMYWMDQHNPGLRTEIKAGHLGATLDQVWGDKHSTNIYAFKPPAGGTP